MDKDSNSDFEWFNEKEEVCEPEKEEEEDGEYSWWKPSTAIISLAHILSAK